LNLGHAIAGGNMLAILNAALRVATPRQRVELADSVREWADGVRQRALGELGERDELDPTEIYRDRVLVLDGEFVDEPAHRRRGR
jgi:hypothetical protein